MCSVIQLRSVFILLYQAASSVAMHSPVVPCLTVRAQLSTLLANLLYRNFKYLMATGRLRQFIPLNRQSQVVAPWESVLVSIREAVSAELYSTDRHEHPRGRLSVAPSAVYNARTVCTPSWGPCETEGAQLSRRTPAREYLF
jgi:hypothetical protein